MQGVEKQQHQVALLRVVVFEAGAQVVGQVRVKQGVGHDPQQFIAEVVGVVARCHAGGHGDIGEDARVVFTQGGSRQIVRASGADSFHTN